MTSLRGKRIGVNGKGKGATMHGRNRDVTEGSEWEGERGTVCTGCAGKQCTCTEWQCANPCYLYPFGRERVGVQVSLPLSLYL